jgi:uncharacterized circularly permuted ATP-grasp superfamily protein/uncharacterized alpha-E superfamily protein
VSILVPHSDTASSRMLLSHGYDLEPGTYDEMWHEETGLRNHWQPFIGSIQKMGPEELEECRQGARLILRENGVTYNVHGDPNGLHRPWELDPIPLLLQENDWAQIEFGLKQRAELFNVILDDLYGPQNLIKQGLLPLELIYNHAGFLRPCHGVKLPMRHQLRLASTDLARGPNGRMWVLRDRTQAPSGLGYALENRTAMARVMPGLFNACNVRRMSGFFRTLQAGLSEIAPHQQGDPHVVMLTPGPYNATYFEHAYLASYLGYTLVQGDDLTVRNGQVWLKSIDGLHPVDIILRRVNDDFCDPLELNEESQLGAAGLLEAVRLGNVAVANPLGSSVLENPGLMAFLPSIAREFLKEDLILPSAATWWCGQPQERKYVLDNLDKLVISPIYQQQGVHRVFGALMSDQERAGWRDRIIANPAGYVGQERVSFATAPALINGKLEPRHTILSTFAVSHQNEYVVMPGGLTRSAPERGNFVVSTQTVVRSKDTWVMSEVPEYHVSMWQQTRLRSTPFGQGTLPSRAAENLFWVGRYAERAESTIRLLRAVLNNFTDRREYESEATRQCRIELLQALTILTDTKPGFVGKGAANRLRFPEKEILDVVRNATRPGSLAYTQRSLMQAAFAIRDRWSTDTWRVIDTMEGQWSSIQSHTRMGLREVPGALNSVLSGLLAFTGLTQESMTRELGWRLLDTGRRIERGLLQIALLRTTLITPYEGYEGQLLLETVLAVMESLITHRRRYRAYLNLQTLLELLLHDETNPRALAYQLNRLTEHIGQLPKIADSKRLSEAERLMLDASTRLRLSEPELLTQVDSGSGHYEALDQLLAALETRLLQTSRVLTQDYFSHARGIQQLSSTHQELENEL